MEDDDMTGPATVTASELGMLKPPGEKVLCVDLMCKDEDDRHMETSEWVTPRRAARVFMDE